MKEKRSRTGKEVGGQARKSFLATVTVLQPDGGGLHDAGLIIARRKQSIGDGDGAESMQPKSLCTACLNNSLAARPELGRSSLVPDSKEKVSITKVRGSFHVTYLAQAKRHLHVVNA